MADAILSDFEDDESIEMEDPRLPQLYDIMKLKWPTTMSCPHCGVGSTQAPASTAATDAQLRIKELEAQVKMLSSKASNAGSSDYCVSSLNILSPSPLLNRDGEF